MKILNLEINNCGECPLSYVAHECHDSPSEDSVICKRTGSSIRKKDQNVFGGIVYFDSIYKLRDYNYINTDCPLKDVTEKK